jgi:hypothetical protein
MSSHIGEDHSTDDTTIIGQNGDAPQSPFEALRARRNEIAESQETFILLTGWEEIGLKGKYRLLDRTETEEIAKRIRKEARGNRSEFMFRVLVDTLLLSCEGFYIDKGHGAPPEPLLAEDSDEHVINFTMLAKNLGADADIVRSPRQSIAYCFGDNDFAVGQHGLVLQRWLNNTGVDVDTEFLGELA